MGLLVAISYFRNWAERATVSLPHLGRGGYILAYGSALSPSGISKVLLRFSLSVPPFHLDSPPHFPSEPLSLALALALSALIMQSQQPEENLTNLASDSDVGSGCLVSR
jgi:hypothetical protein